jgi:hypothetical protein
VRQPGVGLDVHRVADEVVVLRHHADQRVLEQVVLQEALGLDRTFAVARAEGQQYVDVAPVQ